MRKRYKDLLIESITQTVDSPEEVDAELNHLFSSFSD